MATVVDENSTTTETGQGGWQDAETPQPIHTTTPCPQLGKRHRWKGGDTCLRCGTPKSDVTAQPAAERAPTQTRGSTRTGAFETIGAMLWASLGLGIKFQPVVMTQNVKREDGTDVEGKPVKDAVSGSILMQSAMAGKRIDRAFQKASPTAYTIVAHFMKKATWGTELAPLLIAPMFVYGMAVYPQVVGKFKEQIIGLLLPIFVEQAKVAKQQRDLMQQVEEINQETMDEALAMINSLLGNDTAS